jgi:hypothetical protein
MRGLGVDYAWPSVLPDQRPYTEAASRGSEQHDQGDRCVIAGVVIDSWIVLSGGLGRISLVRLCVLAVFVGGSDECSGLWWQLD